MRWVRCNFRDHRRFHSAVLPTNNAVSTFRYCSLCDFNDRCFDLLDIASEVDEPDSAPNICGGGDRNDRFRYFHIIPL